MEEEKKFKTTEEDDEDLLDEDDFDEEDDEEEEESSEENKGGKGGKQSREENAKQAAARRKREEEQKKHDEEIRQQAFEEGKKAGRLESSKVNTFTNEPIEDEYDLKIFEIQKQIKAEGGDPIKDLPKRLAKLNREEEQTRKTKEEETKKSSEAAKNDIKDFIAEVGSAAKAKEIYNDENFQVFIEGKLGKKPLKELYQDYLKFKKGLGVDEDSDEEGRRKGGTPGPNGRQGGQPKKYSSLSKEEKAEFLKKNGLI